MRILTIVLYLAAAICFAVAVIESRRGRTPRLDFVAAGLLLWVLVPLVHSWRDGTD